MLTPHFSLDELVHSDTATARGIDNTLPDELLPNVQGVAEMLERIRSVLNAPISISSGYRCPTLNKAVGGAVTSDHLLGLAADITAPAFGSPTEIARLLSPLVDTLGIGQIILEGVRGRQWVHVSTKLPTNAINRVITITDAGVMPGIVGLA
jgi:zinc D-Ala-D-Ala carboxypeptidase